MNPPRILICLCHSTIISCFFAVGHPMLRFYLFHTGFDHPVWNMHNHVGEFRVSEPWPSGHQAHHQAFGIPHSWEAASRKYPAGKGPPKKDSAIFECDLYNLRFDATIYYSDEFGHCWFRHHRPYPCPWFLSYPPRSPHVCYFRWDLAVGGGENATATPFERWPLECLVANPLSKS